MKYPAMRKTGNLSSNGLVVVFATITVFLIFILVSGYYQNKLDDLKAEYQRANSEEYSSSVESKEPRTLGSESASKSSWDLITKVVELLFAGAIVWAAISLNKIESRNSDTTKDQLRAYVYVVASGLNSGSVGDGKKPTATLEIKNTGQTPADEVKVWSKLEVLKIGANPSIPEDAVYTPINDLGPGMQLNRGDEMESAIDVTVYSSIFGQNATHEFFEYGRIVYLDRFGVERRTDFQMTVGKNSFSFTDGKTSKVNVGFAITGNPEKNRST